MSDILGEIEKIKDLAFLEPHLEFLENIPKEDRELCHKMIVDAILLYRGDRLVWENTKDKYIKSTQNLRQRKNKIYSKKIKNVLKFFVDIEEGGIPESTKKELMAYLQKLIAEKKKFNDDLDEDRKESGAHRPSQALIKKVIQKIYRTYDLKGADYTIRDLLPLL